MIGWTIFFGWLVLGVWFAPRAAALNYRFNNLSYKDMKMTEAKLIFLITLFVGPLMMAYYAVRIYMFGATKEISGSRFERHLLRNDPEYKEKYLNDQKIRIMQLENENRRLTKQVLDNP